MKTLSLNKKVSFNYELIKKYTAGIELLGSEVKLIKFGSFTISNSYIIIRKGEAYTINFIVSRSTKIDTFKAFDEEREKKILLNKIEIKKIESQIKLKRYSVVVRKVYVDNKGLIKLEIWLAKPKKKWDKRESIKKKDMERKSLEKTYI